MQLTNEQRAFVVKDYYEFRSFNAVRNAFHERFPDRKYELEGTSHNLNKGRSGRRRTVRTEETINVVRNLLEEHPRVSCRRNMLNISKTAFNNITSRT